MNLRKHDNKILGAATRFIMVTMGSVIFAFVVKTFVQPANLFPAGFSGITVLFQRIMSTYFSVKVPYSAVYLPLNIIPIIIGLKFLGKRFTLYSIYCIVLSSLLTDIMHKFTITYDALLLALFGGILSGIGVVLCLMAGASGGGTDIISVFFSEKKGIDVWNYIFAANVVLLITAGVLFGFDKALYSIIYQYAGTKVIQLLYRRYQKHTLLIVTDKPDEIYQKIRELTDHDATLFKGEGCYGGSEKPMLYSVVSSEEVTHVMRAIKEVDPGAFVNSIKTEKLGGYFKQEPLK